MTIYFATDHAGFELKNVLISYVRDELGYEIVDCGAYTFDQNDDYPEFVKKAAKAVAEAPNERKAIVLGGSGEGEAMVANRFSGVRAAVYYGVGGTREDSEGTPLDILRASRIHNNANVLSLGARFLGIEEAKQAVKTWLETEYPKDERHERRILMIE